MTSFLWHICNIRSALMKTLDWNVETLIRECNLIGLCIQLSILTIVAMVQRLLHLVVVNKLRYPKLDADAS